MINVTSLYFGECFVKHYEFDKDKHQISIQVNELFILKPGEFYEPGANQPIIDAIIRFYGVSEYLQEPEDKEPNDEIYEMSIKSGRFVIGCGFVDNTAVFTEIQISFLAESAEIISSGSQHQPLVCR
jgi:hypothetical protein